MKKLYPKWKQALIGGSSNSQLNGVVKLVLIDRTAYTYSDTHEFVTSIASAIVGTAQTIGGKSYLNGVFGADPVVNFPMIASGPTVSAIVLYVEGGSNGASRLVYYDDEAKGLPIVSDGGDETVIFDSAGVFQL